MISKKQIDLVSGIVSQIFKVNKVYLFGSYAYGKPDSESDLDICIVANLKGKRKIDMIREIRREISSISTFPIDILLYEYKEFNDRASLHNTFEHKILKDGILING